jgi:hypothetical protein
MPATSQLLYAGRNGFLSVYITLFLVFSSVRGVAQPISDTLSGFSLDWSYQKKKKPDSPKWIIFSLKIKLTTPR